MCFLPLRKLGDGLFLQCCEEVAELYPKIKFDTMIIDNCCMQVRILLPYPIQSRSAPPAAALPAGQGDKKLTPEKCCCCQLAGLCLSANSLCPGLRFAACGRELRLGAPGLPALRQLRAGAAGMMSGTWS